MVAREGVDAGKRKQAQNGAADNVIFRKRPPDARVGGLRTVVAHNKVLVVAENHGLGVGPLSYYKGLVKDKPFRITGIFYSYDISRKNEGFFGKPHDSFYKILARVFGVAENNHFAAHWLFKAVGNAVNNQVFAVFKRRLHRSAGDDKWLGNKKADGENYG